MILITQETLEYQTIYAHLHKNDQVGAIHIFSGLVRAEDNIAMLELEHYPIMTEKTLENIREKALHRFGLIEACIMHRVGKIALGEVIVLCGASASHRKQAVEATDMMMDFLKTDAPFWKKTINIDGHDNTWIAQKNEDLNRRKAWKYPI